MFNVIEFHAKRLNENLVESCRMTDDDARQYTIETFIVSGFEPVDWNDPDGEWRRTSDEAMREGRFDNDPAS